MVVAATKKAAGFPLSEFCSAVARDLTELAVLHDAEPDSALLDALRECSFPETLRLTPASQHGQEAILIMKQALGESPDTIDATTLDALAVDYADIYLTMALRAPPCESVWLDDENLERQEPMFQVRHYYRRHGLAAANWRKRPDDHLVLQLRFLAYLFDPQRSCGSGESLKEAAKFMDEHLLRWLMDFCKRVAARCATPFYAGLALITTAYCEELRGLLVEVLGESRPVPEEIERRMAPKQQVTVTEIPLRYMPGKGPTV